jgi:ribonuclease BN (tRNA processing enzyme)
MLGSGTPNAEADRSGPAVAIVVDGSPYLVDCGPGVVRRAAAAHASGISGLAVPRLRRAFLTHLHSDHTAGLADLILTPWVLGRAAALEVFGPPGLAAMTEHLLAAYEADISERRGGLERANDQGWRVVAHEIGPGVVYRDDHVRVEAFPVRHGSWVAFGYRFCAPGRTVVVSGDTAPNESLIASAHGCDVLVHEVYSAAGFETLAPQWRAYHSAVHTSSRELVQIATRVCPKLLVLYHQLLWGRSEDELLSEITEEYDGKVAWGRDLAVY